MLNYLQFTEFWNSLCDLYGQSRPDGMALQLVFESFNSCGYSLKQLMHAATLYMKNNKFMPRPADLRFCLEGTPEEKALEAYSHLYQFRHHSALFSFQCEDPVLYTALKYLGGWHRFNLTLRSDFEEPKEGFFMRREFLAAYRSAILTCDRDTCSVIPRFKGLEENQGKEYYLIHSRFRPLAFQPAEENKELPQGKVPCPSLEPLGGAKTAFIQNGDVLRAAKDAKKAGDYEIYRVLCNCRCTAPAD